MKMKLKIKKRFEIKKQLLKIMDFEKKKKCK